MGDKAFAIHLQGHIKEIRYLMVYGEVFATYFSFVIYFKNKNKQRKNSVHY